MTIKRSYKESVMKTLLLTLAVLLGSSAMADSHYGPGSYGQFERSPSEHRLHQKHKERFVKVAQSRPIYKEVTVYRECPSRLSRHHNRDGAVIGAVVGGLIGNSVPAKHKLPHVIGGAVTGAIVGSAITAHPQRRQRLCQHTEQQLVGYRNIAYWRGQKIIQISDRPLNRIQVRDKRIKREHYASYR